MSDLQALLAARQAAVASAKVAGAIPGSADPSKITEVDTATLGGFGIGAQSSVTAGAASGPQVSHTDPFPGSEVDAELLDASVAVYKSTGLRRHVDSKGVIHNPVNGFFYISKDSDTAVETATAMAHYETIGKVEQIK